MRHKAYDERGPARIDPAAGRGPPAAASGSSTPGNDFDLRWQRTVEGWTTGGRRDVARALMRLGDGETAVALMGGTYPVSRWTGNRRMQRTASLSAEALLDTALCTTLLEWATRRTRPADGGNGPFFLSDPEPDQVVTSSPCGHAASAFAIATVLSHEYRTVRWVPWVAYGAAGLVAFSRVGLGRHFPSDVLTGALIGNSLGRMAVHRDGAMDDRPVRARIEPNRDPGSGGVGIAYRRSS